VTAITSRAGAKPRRARESPSNAAAEGYSKSRAAGASILLSFQANSTAQSSSPSLVLARAERYLFGTLFSEHSGI
jgi:hypothetical protein